MESRGRGREIAPASAARLVIGGLAALLALALLPVARGDSVQAAGRGEPAAQTGGATQTSEGGQVTVTVTWQGPTAGPVFAVVLDSHSVNLDGYDLLQLAVLRTDQGQEVRPSGWDAPPGSHHREGTLTFPATATDGSPLLGPSTGAIELVIRDVARVPERLFRWAL